MADKNTNIIYDNDDTPDACMDVVYNLSKNTLGVNRELDLYPIIIDSLKECISTFICGVFKLDEQQESYSLVPEINQNGIQQKLLVSDQIINNLYQTGKVVLINKIENQIINNNRNSSLILTPVSYRGKPYALIYCEFPEFDFFKPKHIKLFEVIAFQIENILMRIGEFDNMEGLKHKFEKGFEQKTIDLDKTIETLALKYSELKYQYEKQETLIQEVHHRVSNNLQVISSILRLYLNNDEINAKKPIQEVYDRVQIMSIVHQNLYKSIETEFKEISVDSFIQDICNYLSSIANGVSIKFDNEVNIQYLPHDKLIPLGLLITEILYALTKEVSKSKNQKINIQLNLSKAINNSQHTLTIQNDCDIRLHLDVEDSNETDLNGILIEALVDQLDGSISCQGNLITMTYDL